MAKVLSSYRFVSVVFVVVVLVNVQFSFAVLPATPLFFSAIFISKRRGNFLPSFPLPSPKPLPVLPPPILPSSRHLSTSTKFFVHFRSACTVNPLLFRSCLEVLFESSTFALVQAKMRMTGKSLSPLLNRFVISTSVSIKI